MEQHSVICRYQASVKELRHGLRACRKASGRLSRNVGISAIIVVILMLTVRHLHDLILPLGFGAIGGLIGYGLQERTLRDRPWRDQEIRYTLNQTGSIFEAPSIRSQVEWPRITSARELSTGFILFMGQRKRMYIWLPKHGFTSPADIDRCRALIQEHIKDFRRLI